MALNLFTEPEQAMDILKVHFWIYAKPPMHLKEFCLYISSNLITVYLFDGFETHIFLIVTGHF